MILITFGSING